MNRRITGKTTRTPNLNPGLTAFLLAAFPILVALTGCSEGLAPGRGPLALQAGQIGSVHGGQQPVSGSTITLWRVNTDGSAATSMLTSAVTTASDGTFNITGKYSTASCTANTQVYIMATGGNPGVGSNNGALALMAALGSCTALPSVPNISINEVSTVAAVYALQQFMGVSEGTPFAEDIAVNSTGGLSAQSAAGMINAFATVTNLVSLSTGVANTTVGSATMEAANLNTIANIISYCVNSNGGSPCTSLFSAVTPSGSITPGDTIQAALYIAQNSTNNVANIYALQPATPPFLPNLSSAPFDFSLAITYTNSNLNLPNLLASDASGNIWVTDNAGSGGSQLVELTPNGNATTFLASGSAFDGPQAVLPDTLGNIWISSNSTNSSTGNRLIAYNPTTTAVAKYSNLPSGCQPYSVAIDGHDDIFFACSKLGYLYELANGTSGTPSLGNPPSYASSPTTVAPTQLGALATTGSGNESYGMAIDSLGDVWVANTVTPTNPTLTEYAAGSYSTVANTITLSSGPIGIGIDSSNNVWAVNSGNLELQTYNSGTSYTSSVYTGGGLKTAGYLAIDGRGTIWAVSRNVPSITANSVTTSYITISEYNNNGLAITPGLTTTEPGGLATVTTVTDASPRGMAIDPSGNVWIAGCGLSSSCSSGATSFVMEYVGVASPPVLPLATAQANHQLGCCSFAPVAPTGTVPTDTAGNVSLQTSSYTVTQDNGQFSFEVTRTGGFSGSVSVNYSILAGTAISGTDFTCTTCSSGNSGLLSWSNGDSSAKTISLTWNDTANYIGTKTFTISLSCSGGPCPAAFGPNQSEFVTVTNNLKPPSTQFPIFSNATDNFYLGLPIDSYGGTGGTNGAQFGAQSITNTTLANGFSDPYFYLNASNQIVFTAPSNGATTTPGAGTNDARSELREQYFGTGAIDTDDWDSAIGGTLNATCAVNQTSVDTTEATIGQIHGQNQPFALLQYQPTSSTQGNIVLSVLNSNSTNSSSTSYPIANGINLNAFFSYQLKMSGSSLSASVNGSSLTSMPVTVDSSWVGTSSADGMYFKLGAYSGAPNTGNPAGDQTQVTFSSFSISHP